jgi:hypothetical protein
LTLALPTRLPKLDSMETLTLLTAPFVVPSFLANRKFRE